MTNDDADRHVLAAAVVSKEAHTIITFNVRHFPAAATRPIGIGVVHPDEFLCELYERSPGRVRVALDEQAAALSRPPLDLTDVLARLQRSVPRFAKRVREDL